nr:protein FAM210B, mitochondrial-like isoform X1 [Dermacentor andersoni]
MVERHAGNLRSGALPESQGASIYGGKQSEEKCRRKRNTLLDVRMPEGLPILSQGDAGNKPAPMSRKEKWKHAIKEYGSAMVAFHVVLSFTSFGICYVLVSSGVDMTAVAEKLGFSMDSQWVNSKIAGGSGTLVLAYAVHKLFTPVRMGITLSTTPILVRWLRRNGIWGFRY